MLALLMQGRSNAEIGRALSVSPRTRTADKHLEYLYQMLDVSTRGAAAAKAL